MSLWVRHPDLGKVDVPVTGALVQVVDALPRLAPVSNRPLLVPL